MFWPEFVSQDQDRLFKKTVNQSGSKKMEKVLQIITSKGVY
jgi:hypothetical protein